MQSTAFRTLLNAELSSLSPRRRELLGSGFQAEISRFCGNAVGRLPPALIARRCSSSVPLSAIRTSSATQLRVLWIPPHSSAPPSPSSSHAAISIIGAHFAQPTQKALLSYSSCRGVGHLHLIFTARQPSSFMPCTTPWPPILPPAASQTLPYVFPPPAHAVASIPKARHHLATMLTHLPPPAPR